jgi:hypothetical protein
VGVRVNRTRAGEVAALIADSVRQASRGEPALVRPAELRLLIEHDPPPGDVVAALPATGR